MLHKANVFHSSPLLQTKEDNKYSFQQRDTWIVVAVPVLLLFNPPQPSPVLLSSPSPCKNRLFSGFDKCRSQTPVTGSTAVGVLERCESESNPLRFISFHLSTHLEKILTPGKKKKKTCFLEDAVNTGSCGGHRDNERRGRRELVDKELALPPALRFCLILSALKSA